MRWGMGDEAGAARTMDGTRWDNGARQGVDDGAR